MVNCYSCGQVIHFDDGVVSAKGKKVPLQGNEGFDKHDCPENPYNKGESKRAVPVPDKGNLQDLAVQSTLNDLRERVGRLEQGLEEFGTALAKLSFEKGTGEKV